MRADNSLGSGTLAGLKSHFGQAARERFDLPLAACPRCTGSMPDRSSRPQPRAGVIESLVSIRRAAASVILAYYAKDAARLLG